MQRLIIILLLTALAGLLTAGVDPDSLVRKYRQQGFLDAEISTETRADSLPLEIRKGPRARIAALTFMGNTKIPTDTLLTAAEFRPGEPFSAVRAEDLQQRVLRAYGDRGFPFAAVRIIDATRDSAGVALRLSVEENGRYYFGGLRVNRRPRTRPLTLLRLGRIREGAPFSERDYALLRERWMKSGLFESVDTLRLLQRPGRRILDLEAAFREAPVNSAEGLLGFDPESEGSGLSGALDLTLANIAGTFRKLTVRYRQETPMTRAEAAYTEPWIFGSPASAEAAVTYRAEEGDYTAQSARLRVFFPLRDNLKVYAGVFRSGHTALAAASPGDSLPVTTRTTLSEAGVILDTRDRPDNPRRGTFLTLPLSAGVSTTGNRTSRVIRTESTVEQCVPLHGRHLLFVGLRYAGVSAPDSGLPATELPVLGGTATLRGYREEAFRGRGVASSRFEYRFLPDPGSRLLLFLDLGAYDPRSPALSGTIAREEFLYGYGAGIHLSTLAGLVGLEYGLSRESPLSNGKIHVSFRNRF